MMLKIVSLAGCPAIVRSLARAEFPLLSSFFVGGGILSIGGAEAATPFYRKLPQSRIDLIINLAKRNGVPSRIGHNPPVCYFPIDENADKSFFIAIVEKMIVEVRRVLGAKKEVLVHCSEGLTRSPAFAVILFTKLGMPEGDAIQMVQIGVPDCRLPHFSSWQPLAR